MNALAITIAKTAAGGGQFLRQRLRRQPLQSVKASSNPCHRTEPKTARYSKASSETSAMAIFEKLDVLPVVVWGADP